MKLRNIGYAALIAVDRRRLRAWLGGTSEAKGKKKAAAAPPPPPPVLVLYS